MKRHAVAAYLCSLSSHAFSLKLGCLALCSDELDVCILIDIS